MSFYPDAANEFIYIVKQGFAVNYCSVAAFTVVLYEHILTIQRELHYVWQYRMSGTSILLLMNRLVLLVYGSDQVFVSFLDTDALSCEALMILQGAASTFLFAVAAVFSALRVYAISGRKWHITLIVLLTSLVPVATNIRALAVILYGEVSRVGDLIICGYESSGSPSVATRLIMSAIATFACVVASELIVIGVTFSPVFLVTRSSVKIKLQSSIITVLLKDGALYFVALLLLNILLLLGNMAPNAYGAFAGYIEAFLPSLENIIISRFIFNLRDISTTHNDSRRLSHGPAIDCTVSSRAQASESIQFSSKIIANIGAPLNYSTSVDLALEDGDIDDVGCNESDWFEEADDEMQLDAGFEE